MDLRKVKFPGYYWRHYSTGNVYEIIYFTRKKEIQEYIVSWRLFFYGEKNSVEVVKFQYVYFAFDMKFYEPMKTMPIEAKRIIFKAIFNKLIIATS